MADTRLPAVYIQAPVGGRPGSDAPSILRLARLAEAAGFDGVVLVDHVVMGEHPENYPFGEFPFPSNSPWIEPLTTIAAAAASTERIRFSTSILVTPVRPPGLLAKTVATIDALAPGRLDLGVGLGWQHEEFSANRVAFEDRGQLLDDTIAACRALWTGEPVDMSAPTLSFEQVQCNPHPATPPPVLFGGELYPRNLRRIVDLGDGWMPAPKASDEAVAKGTATLRAAFSAAGRDPSTVQVQVLRYGPDGDGDLQRTLDHRAQYAEMGITAVGLPLATLAPDPAQWDKWFDRAGNTLSG